MCDIWSRQNRPRASVFLCMTNLWSQSQWFCRIHRNCWRRHSRNIWCSRDGRRVAHIGDPLKNRHNGDKTFSLQRIPRFVWILRYFVAAQHYWKKWNIYIEFQVVNLKFNVKTKCKNVKIWHDVWNHRKSLVEQCGRTTFTFWVDKMAHFGEFLKTWSLRSNSVTRQVNLKRTIIDGICENWNIQMRHFEWVSNTVQSVKLRLF